MSTETKELLYKKFKPGFFSEFEEHYAIESMTEYAAQEVAKEREKANKLIEALEGLYIGHQFTASFESKEAQSKYNEALRNAKEAIKTYKHG